jgi:phosphoribosylformimino-5-aminoimidazole carboxamide ribotide isomerase
LAFSEPLELARLTQECGDERVVVALDHQDGKVMVEGWRVPTNLGIDEAIPRFLDLQIRKFLVTSVAKDGTLSGPDFRILDKVCAYDGASVMAAGGISSLDDLVALNQIGVEGVVVGKALYEGMFTLREALEAAKED